MDELRYPVGKFTLDAPITAEQRATWIDQVAHAPTAMRAVVARLSPAKLDTPYRPGGWTARQVVHHVPDSHMNAYCRFKLALTEDEPRIKPYEEARWAELADTRAAPVVTSLTLLEALHARWVALMRSMSDADWRRGYVHPDHDRLVPLEEALALYSWHCRHHIGHLKLVAGGK